MEGFFKKAPGGKIVFTERSRRHKGKTLEEVAKEDPKYLRWARREQTVGVELEIFERIEKVMKAFGIAFSSRRGKHGKG